MVLDLMGSGGDLPDTYGLIVARHRDRGLWTSMGLVGVQVNVESVLYFGLRVRMAVATGTAEDTRVGLPHMPLHAFCTCTFGRIHRRPAQALVWFPV